MKPSGRNDPFVAPKGADQNTPLDGHFVAFCPPHNHFVQQSPRDDAARVTRAATKKYLRQEAP